MQDRKQLIKALKLGRLLQKKRCEASFYEFVKAAWHIVEPGIPLVDNWHIKYLCDLIQGRVEGIARREIKEKDLIVNIPPRTSKSTIVSVMLPAWAWIHWPELRFISASHSKELSTQHCVQSRAIIESDWYKQKWGRRFHMTTDQNVKTYYVNNRRGSRKATSVGAKITGFGADIIISDDLIDPEDANSETKREKGNRYFTDTLFNRLNDQGIGLHIVVQQRLHEHDTTGHLLGDENEGAEKWDRIVLPARLSESVYPPALREYYVDGLLSPQRLPANLLDEFQRRQMGFSAQYMQEPLGDGGQIVQKEWFKIYHVLPQRFDVMIQSWDLSFDEGKDASFVVGQVWGKLGVNAYLVHQFRRQIEFTEQLAQFRMMSQNFPKAMQKLVEKKANGAALISSLKKSIVGIEPVEVKGSKENRFRAVSPVIKSGNVYVPDPKMQDWVRDYLLELTKFPKRGMPDDQVDATSQALWKLFFETQDYHADYR